MTGFWSGTYWYDAPGQPVVPFLLNMDDRAGMLTGTIGEPDAHVAGGASGGRLGAFVRGTRSGAAVAFAKVYDGDGRFAHRVDYAGALSGDGLSVRGVWRLGRDAGGFDMRREAVPDAEVEERVGVGVGGGR